MKIINRSIRKSEDLVLDLKTILFTEDDFIHYVIKHFSNDEGEFCYRVDTYNWVKQKPLYEVGTLKETNLFESFDCLFRFVYNK